MNIAIFCEFSARGYSGGRILAQLMAEAIAANDTEVTIYSNNTPGFFKEYSHFPGHAKILIEQPSMSTDHRHNAVILVPSSGYTLQHYRFFLQAARCAIRNNAPLMFLNFESSGWFNSLCPNGKHPKSWDNWHRVMKYVTHILSISREGDKYARQDYAPYASKASFDYCYPGINSLSADRHMSSQKDDSIIVFTRFSDKHKNSADLMHLLDPALKGFSIKILCGFGGVPDDIKYQLECTGKAAGVDIVFLEGICEARKFEELSRAKAVVALSSFEGFGYAPVEARYCGTPCICFDLPVLREINGDSISYVPQGDYSALISEIRKIIERPHAPSSLRSGVQDLAAFPQFAKRLTEIVLNAAGSQHTYTVSLGIMSLWEHILTKAAELKPQKPVYTGNNDQHFIRRHVQLTWELLRYKHGFRKVALYGCGRHTHWLSGVIRDIKEPQVVALFDDDPEHAHSFFGLQPLKPDASNTNGAEAVVLSTDTLQTQMAQRCKLSLKGVNIINLYEGLHPGPYNKE